MSIYRTYGRLLASSPLPFVVIGTLILAVFTLGWMFVETETELLELWIPNTGRIHDEVKFVEDTFESGDAQAFIFQPKTESSNLLSAAALAEIRDLSEFFVNFTYESPKYGTVTYEQICSQSPLRGENYYPCLMVSVLNCFKEGDVIVQGGSKNTGPYDAYGKKASYDTFNFESQFTIDYLQDFCTFWFPVRAAYPLFVGNPVLDTTAPANYNPISSVESFRSVFLTLGGKDLMEQKLRYTLFNRTCVENVNIISCPIDTCVPDGTDSFEPGCCDCCCVNDYQTDASKINCVISLTMSVQGQACCDYVREIGQYPCLREAYGQNPTALQYGNAFATQCGERTLCDATDIDPATGVGYVCDTNMLNNRDTRLGATTQSRCTVRTDTDGVWGAHDPTTGSLEFFAKDAAGMAAATALGFAENEVTQCDANRRRRQAKRELSSSPASDDSSEASRRRRRRKLGVSSAATCNEIADGAPVSDLTIVGTAWLTVLGTINAGGSTSVDAYIAGEADLDATTFASSLKATCDYLSDLAQAYCFCDLDFMIARSWTDVNGTTLAGTLPTSLNILEAEMLLSGCRPSASSNSVAGTFTTDHSEALWMLRTFNREAFARAGTSTTTFDSTEATCFIQTDYPAEDALGWLVDASTVCANLGESLNGQAPWLIAAGYITTTLQVVDPTTTTVDPPTTYDANTVELCELLDEYRNNGCTSLEYGSSAHSLYAFRSFCSTDSIPGGGGTVYVPTTSGYDSTRFNALKTSMEALGYTLHDYSSYYPASGFATERDYTATEGSEAPGESTRVMYPIVEPFTSLRVTEMLNDENVQASQAALCVAIASALYSNSLTQAGLGAAYPSTEMQAMDMCDKYETMAYMHCFENPTFTADVSLQSANSALAGLESVYPVPGGVLTAILEAEIHTLYATYNSQFFAHLPESVGRACANDASGSDSAIQTNMMSLLTSAGYYTSRASATAFPKVHPDDIQGVGVPFDEEFKIPTVWSKTSLAKSAAHASECVDKIAVGPFQTVGGLYTLYDSDGFAALKGTYESAFTASGGWTGFLGEVVADTYTVGGANAQGAVVANIGDHATIISAIKDSCDNLKLLASDNLCFCDTTFLEDSTAALLVSVLGFFIPQGSGGLCMPNTFKASSSLNAAFGSTNSDALDTSLTALGYDETYWGEAIDVTMTSTGYFSRTYNLGTSQNDFDDVADACMDSNDASNPIYRFMQYVHMPPQGTTIVAGVVRLTGDDLTATDLDATNVATALYNSILNGTSSLSDMPSEFTVLVTSIAASDGRRRHLHVVTDLLGWQVRRRPALRWDTTEPSRKPARELASSSVDVSFNVIFSGFTASDSYNATNLMSDVETGLNTAATNGKLSSSVEATMATPKVLSSQVESTSTQSLGAGACVMDSFSYVAIDPVTGGEYTPDITYAGAIGTMPGPPQGRGNMGGCADLSSMANGQTCTYSCDYQTAAKTASCADGTVVLPYDACMTCECDSATDDSVVFTSVSAAEAALYSGTDADLNCADGFDAGWEPVSVLVDVESESDAENLVNEWSDAWMAAVDAHTAGYTEITVRYFSSRLLENELKDATEARGTVVVGFVLVILWLTAVYTLTGARGGTRMPHPAVFSIAVLVLLFSTLAAMGLAGFFCEAGIKYTTFTVLVVPLLSVGLGINDFLIMAEFSRDVFNDRPGSSPADFLAELMHRAGGTVTMSSACNFCAYILGMLTLVPAVQWFALQVAMTVLCNYIASMTLLMPLLLVEYRVFNRSDASTGGSSAVAPAPSSTDSAPSRAEPVKVDGDTPPDTTDGRIRDLAASIFESLPVRLSIFVFNAVLFLSLFLGVGFHPNLGLKLTDVFNEGSPLYEYGAATETTYTMQAISIYLAPIFRDNTNSDFGKCNATDVDVNFRTMMKDLADTQYEMMTSEKTAPYMYQPYGISSGLYVQYTDHAEQTMCASPGVHSDQMFAYQDTWKGGFDVCAEKRNLASGDAYSCSNTCATEWCGAELEDFIDAENFIPNGLQSCVHLSQAQSDAIRSASSDVSDETLAAQYGLVNLQTVNWLRTAPSELYNDAIMGSAQITAFNATLHEMYDDCSGFATNLISRSCCDRLGAFNDDGGFCSAAVKSSSPSEFEWAYAATMNDCYINMRDCDDEHCYCQASAMFTEFYRYMDDFLTTTDSGRYAQSLFKMTTTGADGVEGTSSCPSEGWLYSQQSFMYTQGVRFDTDNSIDFTEAARDIVDNSALNTGYAPGSDAGPGQNAFAFDWGITALNDQYMAIRSRTFLTVTYACIAVFVVLTVFLKDPVASFVCVVFVFVIETEVYGLMRVCDLQLSDISAINMVMTVGLAVEACGHVARAFVRGEVGASGGKRAAAAFVELVVPLGNGGLTTLLAAVPLSFYGFKYFLDYFFIQYILIVLVCVWNGLIMLPIVLSLVADAGEGIGCLRVGVLGAQGDGDEGGAEMVKMSAATSGNDDGQDRTVKSKNATANVDSL